MGGYAEGNNHRTFYEENPDNSVITVPPRGYGNDVLKYIEEHKMFTQGKPQKHRRIKGHKNEAMDTSIPKSNDSSFVDIIKTKTEVPSSTSNPPFYSVTNDDVFSGYRLQDDEYFLF